MPASFSLDRVVATLERTPQVLRDLIEGLPEDSLRERTEGPDTWSPFDIVGHLAHGEKTDWIARTRIILEGEGDRQFEPFDRFAQEQESVGKSTSDLLGEFEHLRNENLRTLRDLDITSDQLSMTGTHPAFGTVTLEQLLATWQVHDLGHIAQICRVLARGERERVGPWREYLPILGR